MITLQIEVLRHGATIASESYVIARRHELVRLTNKAIARYSLSNRARRQVNLVLIWQCLNARGFWQWRLHDTCGAGVELKFHAIA